MAEPQDGDFTLPVLSNGPELKKEYGDEEDTDFTEHGAESEADESDHSAYRPRQKVEEAVHNKWTMRELYTFMQGPYLELNPEYQRDVVWNRKNMVGLIDSLMENYYIPPVIFNLHRVTDEDGEVRWKRTCVDGKQRLSSVKAFLEGRIGCHDLRGNLWYYAPSCNADGSLAPGGPKRRHILPPDVRKEFEGKTFVAYEFEDLAPAQEEDLFARVQKGVQLTPAEKLRGTDGKWQRFTRMFEDDFHEVISLSDSSRSRGFKNLLECFVAIMEVQHPVADNGIPTHRGGATRLAKFIRDESALNDATKSHLAWVFTIFKELVLDSPDLFKYNQGYRYTKSFAPVEMVAVAMLISVYGEERNYKLLIGDIRMMREMLRDSFKSEIKMNKSVFDAAWKFVDELPSIRGTVDGSVVFKKAGQAAAQTAKKDRNEMVPPSAPKQKSKTPKTPLKKGSQQSVALEPGEQPESSLSGSMVLGRVEGNDDGSLFVSDSTPEPLRARSTPNARLVPSQAPGFGKGKPLQRPSKIGYSPLGPKPTPPTHHPTTELASSAPAGSEGAQAARDKGMESLPTVAKQRAQPPVRREVSTSSPAADSGNAVELYQLTLMEIESTAAKELARRYGAATVPNMVTAPASAQLVDLPSRTSILAQQPAGAMRIAAKQPYQSLRSVSAAKAQGALQKQSTPGARPVLQTLKRPATPSEHELALASPKRRTLQQ